MNTEALFAPLLDLLLKSAALILLGAVLLAALRKTSAANRHAVSTAIFAALLLLPFTKLMPPRWSLALEKKPDATVTVRLPPVTTALTTEQHAAVAPVEIAAQPASRTPLVIPWKTLALSVWLAGAALLVARRAFIALRLRTVVRRSCAIENDRLAAIARELVEVGGVRAEVRESSLCRVPLVAGIVRPVVLLPANAKDWSDALISSALRHELGHIRRRDCITRLLADVVCASYWLNPLVWFAARAMRLAQEQACDDLVLNSGARADEYAGHLVDVVRSLQGDRLTARHALAMAQSSTLETRVLAIVDTTRDRSPRSVRGALTGVAFAATALALCTAAQLRGADEKKPAPAADAATPHAPLVQIEVEAKFIEISGEPAGLPDFLKMRDPNVVGANARLLAPEKVQEAMRMLNQKKGVDVLSAPRVTTKSKQRAIIEIVREFKYPTEWDKDAKTGTWTPSTFETKDVGVSFDVKPTLNADGFITMHMMPQVVEFEGFKDLDANPDKVIARNADGSIDLNLAPRVTEFNGVIDYGAKPKKAGAKPDDSWIRNGHRVQPVFLTRRMDTEVTVKAGDTIVLGSMDREDVQQVEDRNPKTGGVEKTERHIKRRIFVFVTARIVQPDAMPEDPPKGGDASAGATGKSGAAPARARNPFENLYLRGVEGVDGKEWVIVRRRGEDQDHWIPAFVGGNELVAEGNIVVKSVRMGDGFRETTVVLQKGTEIGEIGFKEDTIDASAPAGPPAGTSAKGGAQWILPKVEFRGVTLAEAIEFLSVKSKELDPEKKGVKIILIPSANSEAPKITLVLKNAPLMEVINQLTGLTKYKCLVEDAAITIRPLWE